MRISHLTILFVLSCVILIAFAGESAALTPSDYEALGVVAYWPLDGDGADVSGNGHDGTVEGASTSAGRFGDALEFDLVVDSARLAFDNQMHLIFGNGDRTVWFMSEILGFTGIVI